MEDDYENTDASSQIGIETSAMQIVPISTVGQSNNSSSNLYGYIAACIKNLSDSHIKSLKDRIREYKKECKELQEEFKELEKENKELNKEVSDIKGQLKVVLGLGWTMFISLICGICGLVWYHITYIVPILPRENNELHTQQLQEPITPVSSNKKNK